MKLIRINNKYYLIIALISTIVAVLIYFPEWLSLVGKSMQGRQSAFPGIATIEVVNEIIFTFISLLLLFALNTFIFRFNRFGTHITWQKIVVSFVITWFASKLLSEGFWFLHNQFDIPVIHSTIHFFLHPLRDFVISLIVCISCYLIHLVNKSQMVQIENQQLRAENLLNQYEALKNQLNPHMLFNSLNTLRSLIRETPDKAQDYLQELSYVLRYTLQGDESQSVTLREEMEFVNAYSFLLKMRYEDNLIFDIHINEEAESKLLPPISIQLLIENAVKHNEISSRNPLCIKIHSEGEMLVVSNALQPKLTPSRGTGIGLANLSKRYMLLFKKEIVVQEENGYFSVMLPLI
ncbi:histidine kinase [Parabacteroides sp. OttesenSCG-928-G07]|nr:histidine kinase [Parabacteroides sp. OttesenSCG-928-G07]